MKKTLSMLLVLAMILALFAACGSADVPGASVRLTGKETAGVGGKARKYRKKAKKLLHRLWKYVIISVACLIISVLRRIRRYFYFFG